MFNSFPTGLILTNFLTDLILTKHDLLAWFFLCVVLLTEC
jgi:hypothetical protein